MEKKCGIMYGDGFRVKGIPFFLSRDVIVTIHTILAVLASIDMQFRNTSLAWSYIPPPPSPLAWSCLPRVTEGRTAGISPCLGA